MKNLILVFACLIALGYCQNNINNANNQLFHHRECKKKHHHHDPFYHLLFKGGLFYYLSFIVIKIKIVFVLGTIFTIFLVSGKVYGLIKYIEHIKHKPHYHHEPEKIYIQQPIHHDHKPPHHHHDSIQYSAPPPSGFSSGFSVDKLPPDAQIAGGGGPAAPGQYFNQPPSGYSSSFSVDKLPPNAEIGGGGYAPGQYYNSPPPGYTGRSYNTENLYNNFEDFIKVLKTLDTTELAFRSMKLTSDVCKKRFVCKAEYDSRHSLILAAALNWISDEKYNSYKAPASNETIKSFDDCERLFPNCSSTKI